jgi:alginate biosynthesis protein AlgK
MDKRCQHFSICRHLVAAGAVFLVSLPLMALTAQSASLREVKYALFQDPQADVSSDLRRLAENGNLEAAFLMGDRLARTNRVKDAMQAIEYYQQAFNQGRGITSALTSWVKVQNRFALLRKNGKEPIAEALRFVPQEESFEAVRVRLEIFLVYPELIEPDQVERLIALYDRACITACRTETFRAQWLMSSGRTDEAFVAFEKAIPYDAEAVGLYFNALKEQQSEAFLAFAERSKSSAGSWSAEVLGTMGNLLASLAEKNTPEVIEWLDLGISKGSPSARVAKVNYMLGFSTDFNPDEALKLIDEIEATSPYEGRSLRATALLVRNWRILNPVVAYQLLTGLINDGYDNAYMGLGALHSMGGLDEADQEAAIKAYSHLALQGNSAAFYRIAVLYESGRSICHDKVQAHAYASVSMELGQPNTRGMINRLNQSMDADELVLAQAVREKLLDQMRLAR